MKKLPVLMFIFLFASISSLHSLVPEKTEDQTPDNHGFEKPALEEYPSEGKPTEKSPFDDKLFHYEIGIGQARYITAETQVFDVSSGKLEDSHAEFYGYEFSFALLTQDLFGLEVFYQNFNKTKYSFYKNYFQSDNKYAYGFGFFVYQDVSFDESPLYYHPKTRFRVGFTKPDSSMIGTFCRLEFHVASFRVFDRFLLELFNISFGYYSRLPDERVVNLRMINGVYIIDDVKADLSGYFRFSFDFAPKISIIF